MPQENAISLFRDELTKFFNFDEHINCISSASKEDGVLRHTYLADIRQEHLTLDPCEKSVIVKELSPKQAFIYQKISRSFNPHLENVFCVLEKQGHFISINEFIKAPACMNYAQRSICLEESVESFGCFSERDALVYICQLCEGLETLHKMHMAHNDISPKNILLTDAPQWESQLSLIPPASNRILMKLVDFDISNEQKGWDHNVTSIMGTTPYAAPEILDFRYPTDRVDIYALGCVLHYMLTGKSPKNTGFGADKKKYSQNVLRIIRRCTADYERRYRNISALKSDAMRIIKIFDSRLPKWIYYLPGFRSNTYWKKMLSSLYYFYIIFSLISSSAHTLIYCAGFGAAGMIVFNLTHFEDKFTWYEHFKNSRPYFAQLINNAIVSIIMLVLFYFFWKTG